MPTPEESTRESEQVADNAEKVEDRTVSAPDITTAAKVSQERSGLSESAIGQTGMAEVQMGQKASLIPNEGDDVNRSTPIATEAVEKVLEKASIPSKPDVAAPAQTETQESEKEPPGMQFENVYTGIFGQRRPRSACAIAQSDRGLHFPLTKSLDTTECMNGEQRPG